MRFTALAVTAVTLTFSATASAELRIEPQRSWTQLVSSNGFSGVVLDLAERRVHHFREHIYATEEPRWTDEGDELWLPTVPGGDCFKPQSVYSRDLMTDAYFGIRVGETSTWLTEVDVDLDASGYDGIAGHPRDGGTSIMRMVQPIPGTDLVAITRVFTPWSYTDNLYVQVLEVQNRGDAATGPVSMYGLANLNLGFGRPGARQEIGNQFETITLREDGTVLEQGFAGLVYARPLPAADVVTHTPATFYDHVRDGVAGPIPSPAETAVTGTAQAFAAEWTVDAIAPGESAWAALVVGHDPNPDFVDGRIGFVEDWIDGRTASELVESERDDWAEFADTLAIPDGLTDDEYDLFLHSATVLRMAQVRETSYWLRQNVDAGPDVPRLTGIDGDVATIGGGGEEREHLGFGAMLASLPPGEWTYAWVRDGSYAIVGLTDAGMHDEARAALEFFLRAEANRYVDFGELDGVPLDDYGLSLTRYHGFGIEESDTLCNGDLNFEWDGFGLFLWALGHYVDVTGDLTIVEDYEDLIRDRIAGVIEGLVLPETGLMHADSSIWEVHWFGKEKTFAYTSIAGARGLCDAAWMFEDLGDSASAARFDEAGRRLRQAIAERLTNDSGAIASNLEELGVGIGYWDAAVTESVGFGLFDPTETIATATMDAIRDNLTVPSGLGIFRNDDERDPHDLTPWGSFYDSQEWVFLDYRVSMAARHAGRDAYADDLQGWVRDQSLLNFLLIGENYDENTGEYRNNAPMIGFGAGSYITSLHQREGSWAVSPACGVYYEDDPDFGPGETGGEDAGGDVGTPDAGMDAGGDTGDDVGADAGDAGADAGEDTGGEDTGAEDAGDDTSGEDTSGEDTAEGDAAEDTGAGDTGATDSGASNDGGRTGADASSGGGGGGGCAAAPAGSAPVSGLAVLAMLGLVRRRRRG